MTFEVMRRLIFDGGYLQSHFREAVGLTECVDQPEKPAGVYDALHHKALKQARESLWDDLTRMTIFFETSSKSNSLNTMTACWRTSLRKASRPPDIAGDLYYAPGTLAPGAFFFAGGVASVGRSPSVGLIVGRRNSELKLAFRSRG